MSYFVYIIANYTHKVLYTGVTNNLELRVLQHKNKIVEGFTSRYNCNQLLYYQVFNFAQEAIDAEKKIKGWVRAKKDKLINDFNPGWKDLSE